MTAPDLSRAIWRKSRRSEGSNACVEIARTGYAIAVRDSKNPDDAMLVLNVREWRTFVSTVKQGPDRPAITRESPHRRLHNQSRSAVARCRR